MTDVASRQGGKVGAPTLKKLKLLAAPRYVMFPLDQRQRSMLVYVYTETPTFQLASADHVIQTR